MILLNLKIRSSCISYASFKKKEETRLENGIMSIIKHHNVHLLWEFVCLTWDWEYIIHCNIDNINTPTLSQEESDSLEGPINLQEALSSNLLLLSKMKNDKSPGSDGFTAEFLKFFFTDIYGSLY